MPFPFLPACERSVSDCDVRLFAALGPAAWPGAEWSTEQAKLAMRAIAASPHGCAVQSDVSAVIGAKALTSLQRHEVLIVRPYHDLTRDIPKEAFGPRSGPVVTFPSVADLCAAKRMLKNGDLN